MEDETSERGGEVRMSRIQQDLCIRARMKVFQDMVTDNERNRKIRKFSFAEEA